MTRTVIFGGASDDLIEVEDANGTLTEEYSPADGGDEWRGLLVDSANGDTAYVYVRYERNGCWIATVGIYEEGYKLPDWNARQVHHHRYSTGVALDLPDTVTLEEVV